MSIDSVAISNRESWHFVVRERFYHLLGRPFGRWMFGDIEVHDTSSIVAQDDESEEDTKSRCGHREEVNAHSVRQVIIKKRAPGL